MRCCACKPWLSATLRAQQGRVPARHSPEVKPHEIDLGVLREVSPNGFRLLAVLVGLEWIHPTV